MTAGCPSNRPLQSRWLPLGALFLALLLGQLCEGKDLIKGISYGPIPCLHPPPAPLCIHQDDFMAAEAKPLWGARFRGDLEVMKLLGANHVRLYGNNPANTHSNFLEEARAQGLKVIVGTSDWPYTQSPDNCMYHSDFNCYEQVKASYLENLKKGFLNEEGQYHDSLSEVIVINEPDLKLPGIEEPNSFVKGVISAIDGMLDAEKELNVVGRKVTFTVTFSFAICKKCEAIKKLTRLGPDGSPPPALGQMEELRLAMFDPSRVGYSPKNNLTRFYLERFTNSFNTANPAEDIEKMFLEKYERLFEVPVSIQEYHKPDLKMDQEADLKKILKIAEESRLLKGISFFEFQVRYDKGGSEEDFGMFGLRDNFTFHTWSYFGDTVSAFCLEPRYDEKGRAMPSAVAGAYGGVGVDYDYLCVPDPAKVPLDQVGLLQISTQASVSRMAVFVNRVVKHLGGHTMYEDQLHDAAKPYVGSGGNPANRSFEDLVLDIGKFPSWASWDNQATCTSDRNALLMNLIPNFEWVCSQLNGSTCHDIPDQCRYDLWAQADFAFSLYYIQKGGSPFSNCFFGGTAVFENSEDYGAGGSNCMVSKNPLFSVLSNEGYQEVLKNRDPRQTALYARRAAIALGGNVDDEASLEALLASPPASFAALQQSLRAQPFICGLQAGNPCSTTTTLAPTTVAPITTTTARAEKTTAASTAEPVSPGTTQNPGSGSEGESGKESGGLPKNVILYLEIGAGIFAGLAACCGLGLLAFNLKARSADKKERQRISDARAAARKKDAEGFSSSSNTSSDESESSDASEEARLADSKPNKPSPSAPFGGEKGPSRVGNPHASGQGFNFSGQANEFPVPVKPPAGQQGSSPPPVTGVAPTIAPAPPAASGRATGSATAPAGAAGLARSRQTGHSSSNASFGGGRGNASSSFSGVMPGPSAAAAATAGGSLVQIKGQKQPPGQSSSPGGSVRRTTEGSLVGSFHPTAAPAGPRPGEAPLPSFGTGAAPRDGSVDPRALQSQTQTAPPAGAGFDVPAVPSVGPGNGGSTATSTPSNGASSSRRPANGEGSASSSSQRAPVEAAPLLNNPKVSGGPPPSVVSGGSGSQLMFGPPGNRFVTPTPLHRRPARRSQGPPSNGTRRGTTGAAPQAPQPPSTWGYPTAPTATPAMAAPPDADIQAPSFGAGRAPDPTGARSSR